MYTEIEGSVVSPQGFMAAGGFCGLKKSKSDLAIIVSEGPCAAAGVFTQNRVKAAPVWFDMALINSNEPVRGIIANSGNANACTGEEGDKAAKAMSDALAALCGGSALVCSTGVIAVPLPVNKVTGCLPTLYKRLGASPEDGMSAAQAICTTDTYTKTAAAQITVSGKTVTIGAMAKGSGMIHPNMATLLGFVTTDAAIEREALRQALKDSVVDTYNQISVDGDSSTNDTILLLANGAAGNDTITQGTPEYADFLAALTAVNRKLAMLIARDGEGATKLLECRVTGAKTKADARLLSKSVIASSLFKAAMFGADANCGRAICAMGYSGGYFSPERLKLTFDVLDKEGTALVVYDDGPVAFDEAAAKALLSNERLLIGITLADGGESATAWGCDLTYDYVKINGDYRS